MSDSAQNLHEHIDYLSSVSKAKAFLGREFLNWPWYYADSHNKNIHLKSSKDNTEYAITLWIDDKMVFETYAGKSHVHSMHGGDPAHSLEAYAAFQSGKTLKELKLGVQVHDVGEFVARISSDGIKNQGLEPRSLRLPDNQENQDEGAASGVLARRIRHTEIFLDILDGLFALFLDERSQDDWEKTIVKQFKEWIAAKNVMAMGARQRQGFAN